MFFFGKKKSAHHIVVLPHPQLCPAGEVVPALIGKSIAEALVAAGVELSHSCQFQCSCTTCHVFVMEGAACLSARGAEEAKVLAGTGSDDRWSRLACQSLFQGGGDVVVEIRNV
ncbi:2Fe-2S ferredoxin [mine drainage metagenome]|uniref:2Fe-2S ferredoxin n=1 Tax=mine drainage metagenome TaxID=410659 RepID=A0A1J5SFF8_9ZZZZ